MTTANQQIAAEILRQLGGNKFRAMTGAKDFVAIEQGLAFTLPRGFAKNGINKIRITLTPEDLYKIEFLKIFKMNVTTVGAYEGIYCEDMQALFTNKTGLDCHL